MKYFILSLMLLIGCGVNNDYRIANSDYRIANEIVNDGSGGYQIFGDSIFATLNHRIKSLLEKATQITIKDHSVSGAWTKEIKQQYIQNRDQKIKVVILDGGGNDVFGNSGDCRDFNDKCKKVVEEGLQNHRDIFNMAAEDGVHNIVLLGFHYTVGWNGGYNKVIDYTYPLLAELCTNSLVPCQLVDPRTKIRSEHLDWDGTHPNAQGAQILADLILNKLPLFTVDF